MPNEVLIIPGSDEVTILADDQNPSVVAIAGGQDTLLIIDGTVGPQGPPGAAGGSTVEKTAAVNVSGHRAVTPRQDGTVEYATNTDPDHAGAALWLTTQAAAADDQVSVHVAGEFTNPGWSWTVGPVWLAANGQLTQTPPASPALFSRQVGAATSATSLLWQPGATYQLTT